MNLKPSLKQIEFIEQLKKQRPLTEEEIEKITLVDNLEENKYLLIEEIFYDDTMINEDIMMESYKSILKKGLKIL
ncbi:MAG: hypothetical protein ACOC3Z_02485, partial [Nanoarchaeota archaeon]